MVKERITLRRLMKTLYILASFLFTATVFSFPKLENGLNKAVELLGSGNDIEVIAITPYYDCGPCSMYEVLLQSANQDETYNAQSWLGKVFNDEVYLKKATINDYEAKMLGLIGYPTTAILKNGKYLGSHTGAITLEQLGKLLDKATNRNKYEAKGREYLEQIIVNNLKARVRDF